MTIYDFSTQADENVEPQPNGFRENMQWEFANDTFRNVMALIRQDDADRREPTTSYVNNDITPQITQTFPGGVAPGLTVAFRGSDVNIHSAPRFLDSPIYAGNRGRLRADSFLDDHVYLAVWNDAWQGWQLLTPPRATPNLFRTTSFTGTTRVLERNDIHTLINGPWQPGAVFDLAGNGVRWPVGQWVDIRQNQGPGTANDVPTQLRLPAGHTFSRYITFRDGSSVPFRDPALVGNGLFWLFREFQDYRYMRLIKMDTTEWVAIRAPQ